MAIATRRRALLSLFFFVSLTGFLVAGDESDGSSPPPGSAADLFNPSGGSAPNGLPDLPVPPRPGQPDVTHSGGVVPRSEPSRWNPFEAPVWLSLKPADIDRRKHKSQSETDWGFVASEFVWRSPERGYDLPFDRGEWSTEDLFAVPLSGPLYVFTEVTLGGEYSADQMMKVIGKSGLLWRMPIGEGTALEVRGGPTVKYNDALRPEKARDQAAMLWELKARCPLIGPLNLEYLGEALPGLTPEERGQLNQDVNLFVPISGGKVKFGAKHRWDPGQPEMRTATGLMQLYMGIEIGR
jgi:hypothetical protein